jgi:ATP-dependent DNA helicase RecG
MTDKELQQTIAQGEGYYTEFKRELNSDIKREMVAFANASGGKIFLGIDDNGSICGVKIDNKLRSEIQQHANECDPAIDIETEVIDNVMVVTVPEGKQKPYRSTGGFYLRMGPNSQKMDTDKIAEYVERYGRVRFDERIRKDVNMEEVLSDELVDTFIALAGIKNVFKNRNHILQSLGVAKPDNEKHYLTNAGILFFTKDPSSFLPQAVVTCVAYNGTTKVDILDRKDFAQDIVQSVEAGLAFLRRHLNEASSITGLRREDKLEIPLVALREALVNAVAHRDYLEAGARIMVEIFSDKVIISNPGGLPPGLSEKDFGKYSLSRNPLISSLLLRAGLIEKLGTGVNRIKTLIKEAHLPEPQFSFNDFFAVTFLREGSQTGGQIGGQTGIKKLTQKQFEILSIIKQNPHITKPELCEKLGINPSAVDKHIKILRDKGVLKRVGPDKGGYWETIEVG